MSVALCRAYTRETRLLLVLKAVTSLRMEHYMIEQSEAELKDELQRLAWELFSRDSKCNATWALNRALEWVTAKNEFLNSRRITEEVA